MVNNNSSHNNKNNASFLVDIEKTKEDEKLDNEAENFGNEEDVLINLLKSKLKEKKEAEVNQNDLYYYVLNYNSSEKKTIQERRFLLSDVLELLEREKKEEILLGIIIGRIITEEDQKNLDTLMEELSKSRQTENYRELVNHVILHYSKKRINDFPLSEPQTPLTPTFSKMESEILANEIFDKLVSSGVIKEENSSDFFPRLKKIGLEITEEKTKNTDLLKQLNELQKQVKKAKEILGFSLSDLSSEKLKDVFAKGENKFLNLVKEMAEKLNITGD